MVFVGLNAIIVGFAKVATLVVHIEGHELAIDPDAEASQTAALVAHADLHALPTLLHDADGGLLVIATHGIAATLADAARPLTNAFLPRPPAS